jgi:PTS system nitrogen regulatory IIA component
MREAERLSMRIIDILSKDSIVENLTSRSKKEVIQELVKALPKGRYDSDKLVQILLEREKLGSTGIGDGVAIPHGKLGDIDKLMASFGRSKKGVDFDALDGSPTHLFFLLVAPENSAGIHLKALAKISRLFKDGQFRNALMSAKDKEEIYDIIKEEDEKYE